MCVCLLYPFQLASCWEVRIFSGFISLPLASLVNHRSQARMCNLLIQNKGKENEKGKKARAQRGSELTYTKLARAILVPTVPRETQNSRKPILKKPEPVCRDQHSCWIYGTLGTSICQVPHRQPWHWHRWRWIFIQSSEPSDSINPRGFDDEFLSFFILFIFTLMPSSHCPVTVWRHNRWCLPWMPGGSWGYKAGPLCNHMTTRARKSLDFPWETQTQWY